MALALPHPVLRELVDAQGNFDAVGLQWPILTSLVGVASGPTIPTVETNATDLALTKTWRGGPLLAVFVVNFAHTSASGFASFSIAVDGVTIGVPTGAHEPTANGIVPVVAAATTTLAAGGHTVAARWVAASSGGSSPSTNRSLVLLEC